MPFEPFFWPKWSSSTGINHASKSVHKFSSRFKHDNLIVHETAPKYPLKNVWAEIVIYLCSDLYIFAQDTWRIMKIDYPDQILRYMQ